LVFFTGNNNCSALSAAARNPELLAFCDLNGELKTLPLNGSLLDFSCMVSTMAVSDIHSMENKPPPTLSVTRK